MFALCVGLAYAINWAVFVPSFLARTETYFDLTGALTYLTVTAVALALSDGLDFRAWLAAAHGLDLGPAARAASCSVGCDATAATAASTE